MDWFGSHRASIHCRKKTIICQDDQGKDVEIVGILRPISLRMIFLCNLSKDFVRDVRYFILR